VWNLDETDFLLSQEIDLEEAIRDLQRACKLKQLTFIVGNGLSRNAVFESAHDTPPIPSEPESWNTVVSRVFRESGLGDPIGNGLIMAQAIIKTKQGKRKLIEGIEHGLRDVRPSLLHRMLVHLAPGNIITTNYDLLLESAFSGQQLSCYARDNWTSMLENELESATHIFKMHGTSSPQLAYPFQCLPVEEQEACLKSIVIAEEDYDACTQELVSTFEKFKDRLFWGALGKTILIVGKGVYWEDLSFMYALRKRLDLHHDTKAYWLHSNFSDVDRLTLQNMSIHPIQMSMPQVYDNDGGYHFFANFEALKRLFCDSLGHFELPAHLKKIRSQKISAPRVVAVGLAAYNTSGFPKVDPTRASDDKSWYGQLGLPREGRLNLEFAGPEQYPGGSALTAITTCANLQQAAFPNSGRRDCAMVSIIGKDGPGGVIQKHCNENQIDIDALDVRPGVDTWNSTILVHGCTANSTLYPGQRLFLDISSRLKVIDFASERMIQLQRMLEHTELRVLYFDKWMAYPENVHGDRSKAGFFGSSEMHDYLVKTLDTYPFDVIYESGGSGSSNFSIERHFQDITNIFAASFPCFRDFLLPVADKDALIQYGKHAVNQESPKYEVIPESTKEFIKERAQMERLLDLFGLCSGHWIPIPPELVELTGGYLRPNALRRWMTVTLHENGALALNLSPGAQRRMKWFSSVGATQEGISNTAGAGDVFRGALIFGLLQIEEDSSETALDLCTRFAVRCSLERCKHDRILDFYSQLKQHGAHWWDQAKAVR